MTKRTRREPLWWTALSAVLAVSSAVVPARAAPPGSGLPSVHVLGLGAREAKGAARALTLALRRRVNASREYTLADSDLPLDTAAAPCTKSPLVTAGGSVNEPARSCLDQVGAFLRGGLISTTIGYVWGTVVPSDRPKVWAVRVHLWREGQPDVLVERRYDEGSVPAESAALDDVAEDVFARLVVGEDKVGRVRVVAPAGLSGELQVDGQPRGMVQGPASRELTLPVGSHTVQVREGRHVMAQGQALVAAGTVHDLALGGVAGTGSAVSATSASPHVSSSSNLLPWAMVGVGAFGVVGTAIFLPQWASASGDVNDRCKNMRACPPDSQDAQSRRSRNGTLTWVSAGAVAVGVVGGVLLWSRPSSPSKGAVAAGVTPVLGGAAASVSGRF